MKVTIPRMKKEVRQRMATLLHYKEKEADSKYIIGVVIADQEYHVVETTISKGKTHSKEIFSTATYLAAKRAGAVRIKEKKKKGYYDIESSLYPFKDEGLTDAKLLMKAISKYDDDHADSWDGSDSDADSEVDWRGWEKTRQKVANSLEPKIADEFSGMKIVVCIDNKGIEDEFTIGCEYVAEKSSRYTDTVDAYGDDGKLKTCFSSRFEHANKIEFVKSRDGKHREFKYLEPGDNKITLTGTSEPHKHYVDENGNFKEERK